MPRPNDGAPSAQNIIPGDGIGPLVMNAVEQVIEVMHATVYFEKYLDSSGSFLMVKSQF
ncbi:putative isocitrate dehydrogenase (NAD(+)) [Rosa chinensis]|uniref:Putative isocitrate dehydrogenase (NAD(+)) n=1 Tax=Rosa chinensis TaxID=74649 RepID=A0A2P6RW53_ROSCH|nr:putative isocitrate dehydrogenase (NAD(+)) [Rosa chinensis]